jgi:hypothetical protein
MPQKRKNTLDSSPSNPEPKRKRVRTAEERARHTNAQRERRRHDKEIQSALILRPESLQSNRISIRSVSNQQAEPSHIPSPLNSSTSQLPRVTNASVEDDDEEISRAISVSNTEAEPRQVFKYAMLYLN